MSIKISSSPASGPDLGSQRLVKNTGLNFLGLVVPALIGLVTVPVVIHFLGTERFGLFAIILTVFGYFALFDLGLGKAAIKFSAEAMGRGEMGELPRILWTSVGLQTIFGLIGMALMIAVTPFLAERVLKISAANLAEAKGSLVLMALSLPFAIVTPAIRGVLEAGQRFDLVNAVKIPTNALIYLLPMIGAPLGMGVRGIVLLLTVSRVVTVFVWIGLVLRVYPVLRKRVFLQRAQLRTLFVFSGWNALSSFVWFFLVSADRFVIGRLRGLTALGYYAAPAEATARMSMLPGSLGLTLFPAFSALEGGGEAERSKRLYARALKFTLILLGPLTAGLIALAGFVMRMWLGSAFAVESRFVLQIMALSFLISALAFVPYSYLQGLGRADLPTKMQIIELVVFTPMLWFGVKLFGLGGAAIACCLRALLDLGLLLAAASRIGGISFGQITDARIVRIGMALGVYTPALFAAKALPLAPLWILALSGLYGLCVWKSGFDREERENIERILRGGGFLKRKKTHET
jgi:O-antigen/teichoic acid export membrane protein